MKKEYGKFFELTAKAVIVNEENQVLLVRREKHDPIAPGKYDLPGGRVETGEGIRESVIREVEEELGVEVELGPVIYAFDFGKEYEKECEIGNEKVIFNGKGLRFLAFYKGSEIKLSKEHDKYEWLSLEKALEKFGDSDFEKDKAESIKEAKKYLEMQKAQENMKRLAADFENYKKRQVQVQKEWAQFSNMNLIMQILPVLDNFHASTNHIPEDQKDNPWVVGIMHIQKQLEKVLEDSGVEEIKTKKGDEFDPTIHEAVKQESENKKQETENKIKKIILKGYKIGNKIIRAVRVVVN